MSNSKQKSIKISGGDHGKYALKHLYLVSKGDLPIMTAPVVQRGTRSLSKGQQGEYVG